MQSHVSAVYYNIVLCYAHVNSFLSLEVYSRVPAAGDHVLADVIVKHNHQLSPFTHEMRCVATINRVNAVFEYYKINS